MKLRIAATACAVMTLAFGAVAHADAARTPEKGSIVLANMAPPEPEQPAATPAAPAAEGTAPADAPAATPPAEGTTPEATPPASTPAEASPPEAAPPVDATAEATPAADSSAPASSGGMPWLWIAVGVAIAGALGFGLWRRGAGG